MSPAKPSKTKQKNAPAKKTAAAKKKKNTRRYDLPLNQSRGTGFLIWVITMMVYLATIIVAITIALSAMTGRWTEGLAGKVTVEIPFEDFESLDKEELSEKMQTLVRRLNGMDFISNASTVGLEEVTDMIEPWLGNSDIIDTLPLPRLIHVEIKRTATPSMISAMQESATEIFANARIDSHKRWLDDLTTLANAVRFVFGGLGLIIIITAISAVSGAARSRLAIHAREVSLLHQMGADDSYIAGQFQRQSMRLAIKGGGIGFLMAILTIIVAGHIGGDVKQALLPNFTMKWYTWIILCTVPAGATFIAMITARMTVIRALKKLP